MRNLAIYTICTFFFIACTDRTIKKSPTSIAKWNDNFILQESIDSSLSLQLFNLRLKKLDELFESRVLNFEADKNNMSTNEYLNKFVNKNNSPIQLDGKLLTEDWLGIDSIGRRSFLSYLTMKVKRKHLIDSLKSKYDYTIQLKQPSLRKMIDLEKIETINIDSTDKDIDLIIISSFDCSTCQGIKSRLTELFAYHNGYVNFKFVHINEYIGNRELASFAASRQGKYLEMSPYFYSEKFSDESLIYSLASKLNLKLDEFDSLFRSNDNLRSQLSNSDILLKNNIVKTPTFILNGNIIEFQNSIEYLHYYLEFERYKGNN